MLETEQERRDESGAHHLAALLRRSSTVVVDGNHDECEWQRLRCAALALRAKKGGFASGWRRWWLVPMASAAALAGALLVVFDTPEPELVCKVRATGVTATSFVADKDQPLDLDFSDGSTARLSGDSHLRLPEVRSNGAVLELERGEVHVTVRHQRNTRWQLQAGPYQVRITGTRFRASWEPTHGALDVHLLEGSVAVVGGKLTAPLPLSVGQHLHATRTGDVVIRSREGSAPASTTIDPGPAERPSANAHSPTSARPGEPNPARKPGCDFSPLLTKGRFQTILAEARSRGLRVVQANCPISELFVLSDAARYVGDLTLSEETLTAIRRRSPGNDRAAFFLGRLEEIRGRPRLAMKWYALVSKADAVYLAEARVAQQRLEGAAAPAVRKSPRKAGSPRGAGRFHP